MMVEAGASGHLIMWQAWAPDDVGSLGIWVCDVTGCLGVWSRLWSDFVVSFILCTCTTCEMTVFTLAARRNGFITLAARRNAVITLATRKNWIITLATANVSVLLIMSEAMTSGLLMSRDAWASDRVRLIFGAWCWQKDVLHSCRLEKRGYHSCHLQKNVFHSSRRQNGFLVIFDHF